jgi:hypothetical protein
MKLLGNRVIDSTLQSTHRAYDVFQRDASACQPLLTSQTIDLESRRTARPYADRLLAEGMRIDARVKRDQDQDSDIIGSF